MNMNSIRQACVRAVPEREKHVPLPPVVRISLIPQAIATKRPHSHSETKDLVFAGTARAAYRRWRHGDITAGAD
jgi:hypothetical protein